MPQAAPWRMKTTPISARKAAPASRPAPLPSTLAPEVTSALAERDLAADDALEVVRWRRPPAARWSAPCPMARLPCVSASLVRRPGVGPCSRPYPVADARQVAGLLALEDVGDAVGVVVADSSSAMRR